MSAGGPMAASTIMPLMRYRDVGAAVTWLSDAFGFETHFSATAPDGAVFYAELRLGDSMIMLGAVGEPSLDAMLSQPGEADARETQSCYVIVSDTQAHFERARNAGAQIVLDHKVDDKGGRGYACRDPEGHVWNFGTYDPWRAQPGSRGKAAGRASPLLRAMVVATLAGSVVTGWWVYAPFREAVTRLEVGKVLFGDRGEPSSAQGWSTGTIDRDQDAAVARTELSRALSNMAALKAELERERAAREAAKSDAAKTKAVEQAAKTLETDLERTKAQLERERAARDAAAGAATAAKAEAAKAKSVEQAAKTLETDLERTKAERERNATVARESGDALTRERQAKETALAAVASAQDEINRERVAKEAALKAAGDAEGKMATAAAANAELQRQADELRQQNAALQAERDQALKTPASDPTTVATKPAPTRERPLKRLKSVSAARKKLKSKKPYPEPNWPFNSW